MKSFTLIGAALLLGSSLPAMAAVTAELEPQQVAPGDTVQLILRKDSSGGGDPDLAPLKQDFDVLDSSTGSSIQFVNGHMSAQRELRLSLAPKRSGKLQVPSLDWDGDKTEPLTLEVSGSAAGQSGNQPGSPAGSQSGGRTASNSGVLLTSSVDQTQPYVQGAVVLTVRIHIAVPLYQAGLELNGNNDLQVQQLGQDSKSSEERDGRQYEVIERQYLLQPLRSGSIHLDGPTLDGQVADASRDPFADAFGNSPFAGAIGGRRTIRLHGDPIDLQVQPRPAAAAGRDWLPAKEIKLAQGWRPDDASVHAGEPLTLHLGLTALGLTAAQLPDLSAALQLPDGLKAYPDQAKLDTKFESGDIVASREQDIALIASRPGRYHIPALHLSWWDVRQNQAREAVLPERELDVLPAPGAAAAPAAPANTAPATASDVAAPAAPDAATAPAAASIWPWVSLALGLLWLATLAAWWHRSRRAATAAPAPAAPRPMPAAAAGPLRKAFLEACQANDARAARQALLAWARAASPQHPPAGLTAIARAAADPALPELLAQLDRACYAGGDWQGAALAQALRTWPGASPPGPKKAPDLSPLYP